MAVIYTTNNAGSPVERSLIEQKITELNIDEAIFFTNAEDGPVTNWEQIAVCTQTSAPVYYIPNKREVHFAGKPQSGASLNFSHYIYDIVSNTITRTFVEDFNTSSNNGHLWSHCADQATGDFYMYCDFGSHVDELKIWNYSTWNRITDGWTYTSSANINSQLGQSLTSLTNVNGIGWHPNLFDINHGGVVVYGTIKVFAYDPLNNQWFDMGEHNQATDRNTGGKGVYLPGRDELILGTGQGANRPTPNKALLAISSGSGGSPGNFEARAIPPIQICGDSSNFMGHLINDPFDADHLLLISDGGNYWRSVDGAASWTLVGTTPIASSGFTTTNGDFICGSVFGGVWFLSSRGNGGQGDSLLWKPV